MSIAQNTQIEIIKQFFKDPKNIIICASLTLNLILVSTFALWFFTPIFIWQTAAIDLPKLFDEFSKTQNNPEYSQLYQKMCTQL